MGVGVNVHVYLASQPWLSNTFFFKLSPIFCFFKINHRVVAFQNTGEKMKKCHACVPVQNATPTRQDLPDPTPLVFEEPVEAWVSAVFNVVTV